MKKLSAIVALSSLLLILFLSSGVSAQTKGWGSNLRGKLGISSLLTPQSSPVDINAVPDAAAISGNTQFTLFLKSNGRIVSVGDNSLGQLGNGNVTAQAQMNPGAVQDMIEAVQISAGVKHAVALRKDGSVWSWGRNDLGQFGNGTISTQLSCMCIPFPMKAAISNVVQVDASDDFTFALKADGTVWGWGHNTQGQLGINATGLRQLTPAQVGAGVPGFNNMIAISADEFGGMALKSDGTVWAWGSNSSGQMGNGTFGGAFLQPVQNTSLTNVTQISAGSNHHVALKTDGTIWTWGLNSSGQAGNGSFDDTGCRCLTLPQQSLLLINPVDIEALGTGTLARMPDGSVWGWGSNPEGELGDGTVTTGTTCNCRPSPVQTLVGTGNAVIGSAFSSGNASMPSFSILATQERTFGRNVSLFFQGAGAAGTAGYLGIDAAATGLTVPPGYTVPANAPGYSVTSTLVPDKNYICLTAAGEYDSGQFSLLKILHEEGSNLVDRTVSSVFIKRQVCAEAPSFSRFIIAKGTLPTSRLIAVSGRVATASGIGLSNATVVMTDGNGVSRQTRTSPFGYYSVDSVPALETYSFTASSKGHRINTQYTLTLVGSRGDLNFTAQ